MTMRLASGNGGNEKRLLDVTDLEVSYVISRGYERWRPWGANRVVRAVAGVSLAVRRGEMLALVGESGCGKSTTALAILRMVAADAGSIRLDGEELTSTTPQKMRQIRRRMQLIYQDPYDSLDPRFRVRSTVEEPLLVHRMGSKEERHRKIVHALERAGLSPADAYLDRYPHELSGGQRQRLAIASSLVLEPELLVADEPVSMLDVSVRAGVLALLDSLRKEERMGVLMITHDLSTAATFADRIAVMYLGRIVEEGPSQDIVTNPKHPYTQALLSVVPNPDPRQRVPPRILRGETPNPVRVPSGCRFHPRCPIAQAQCKVVDPELRSGTTRNQSRHAVACLLAKVDS
jgi:oligopeptide/dipeptide ABC transporter ATP-binding protein